MSTSKPKKNPVGRPPGKTAYAGFVKVNFAKGFAQEVQEVLAMREGHPEEHAWLRGKQHLLRELLRRGMESVKDQLEEEAQGVQLDLKF